MSGGVNWEGAESRENADESRVSGPNVVTVVNILLFEGGVWIFDASRKHLHCLVIRLRVSGGPFTIRSLSCNFSTEKKFHLLLLFSRLLEFIHFGRRHVLVHSFIFDNLFENFDLLGETHVLGDPCDSRPASSNNFFQIFGFLVQFVLWFWEFTWIYFFFVATFLCWHDAAFVEVHHLRRCPNVFV